MKKNSGGNVVLGVGLNKPIGIKKLRIKQSFFNHDEEKPNGYQRHHRAAWSINGISYRYCTCSSCIFEVT